MSVHIFGIRHHGPGSARALRQTLEALAPDIVLVEGPPDAEPVLPLLTQEGMRPPVALLIYVPEQPARAVSYPFTTFSPEWQALTYALDRSIPARFIDLPQAIQLALVPDVSKNRPTEEEEDEPAALSPRTADAADLLADAPVEDPLAALAHAAGYSDSELWWERQIEQRRDLTGFFAGILEAMTALRADSPPKDATETRREAHMRQSIRAAEREGFERIAVVCGAWHAPALSDQYRAGQGRQTRAKADTILLTGLKRVKVQATWIPWTNSRLAARSGYGAGVPSPGWYEHLWTTPQGQIGVRWMAKAAHLLRAEGIDASSASVIEAVRLADALAAMRDLPMPGLAEMHEATQTVLCGGEAAPMRLIRDRLEIGDVLGAVPPATPSVPLQRDLEAQQRRLRLALSTEIKALDLDLRGETDRARSILLHRLRLLGIEWGRPMTRHGKTLSTFHELWQLQWQPELALAVIEANVYGNTVAQAATAAVLATVEKLPDLPALTALLDRVVVADLPEATERLLTQVESQAAIAADVRHLMSALPPLARLARYGDVRGTRAERILPLIATLFARVLVGVLPACATLDDDAAGVMVECLARVQESVALLDRAEMRAAWQAMLRDLLPHESIHGLVRGRCCRLLLDASALAEDEVRRLANLALSPVNPASQAAAWVEGVLRGSGLVLLHQDGLWRALDAWLATLAPEAFVALLPLLRRAFSDFAPPERRAMGEKVKHIRTTQPGHATPGEDNADEAYPLDRERAERVLPVLAHILGTA